MTRGRFITLEGGEGVGKSTQARAVAEVLRARGIPTIVTREPGGTTNAEAIRGLLMSGSDDRWSARGEALLFAAARADHVERVIDPALAAGTWVICDRFVDSSRVYQTVGGDLTDAEVMTMHALGSRGLLPDRTLLMTLEPDEATRRVAARGGADDRFAARSATALAARFANRAAAEPSRFRMVDVSGDAVDVTARLLAALADLLT